MKISENQIVRALHKLIDESDDDMLAWFAGDMFGGTCEYVGLPEYDFEFTPDKNYMGAFDDGELNGWLERMADRIEPELTQD